MFWLFGSWGLIKNYPPQKKDPSSELEMVRRNSPARGVRSGRGARSGQGRGRRGARSGRRVARRRVGSLRRSSKKPTIIPLETIQGMMCQLIGRQTRAEDGKTEGIRVARVGAFGLSNLLEKITKSLLEYGAQVLEDGDEGSNMKPKHLMEGLQTNPEVRNAIYRIIEDPGLKSDIAALHGQLKENVPRAASRGQPRGRSSPRRGRSSPKERRSRSRSRSPAERSSPRSGSVRGSEEEIQAFDDEGEVPEDGRPSRRESARERRTGASPAKMRMVRRSPTGRSARMRSAWRSPVGRSSVRMGSLAGMRPVRRSPYSPPEFSDAAGGRQPRRSSRLAMKQRSSVRRSVGGSARMDAAKNYTWTDPAEENRREFIENVPSPGRLVGTAAKMQSIYERRERARQARDDRQIAGRPHARRPISPAREDDEPGDDDDTPVFG